MPRRQLAEIVRSLDVIGPVSRALAQNPSASHPMSKPVTSDDTAFFDLFRNATVNGTCSIFPSSFWSETVIQMAHSESAIWHATLAIAALHKRLERLKEGADSINDQSLISRAETHYAKALALAQDLNADLQVTTLAILLLSAACLLERWPEMQMHLMAGLKIVSSKRQQNPGLRAMESTLMRLDLQAMTFSESSSLYPYEVTVTAFPVAQYLSLPLIEGNSYEELSSEMFGLFRAYMILDEDYLQGSSPCGPWLTSQNCFLRRLAHWESRMAAFESTHPPIASDEATRLCIRLWHVTARALIRATPTGGERRYDSLLGYFEYGIKIALAARESMRGTHIPSLSLEPGIVVPLWSMIHRCRHQGVRHAALAILQDCSRTEAMWKGRMAAAIIKAVVDVEEEMTDSIQSAGY
ncbi:hypothetical protein ACLX1H_008967 [Fusarium chlamydosporum]